MRLELVREPSADGATFGRLYVNGVFSCHTLEDTDRELENSGKKIPGQTAIPTGEYVVTIDWSNRFKKEMLHVLNVPQFEGIRIHAGNTAADTEGCILVGNGRGKGFLLDSRAAVSRLFDIVDAAIERGDKVTLEIKR